MYCPPQRLSALNHFFESIIIPNHGAGRPFLPAEVLNANYDFGDIGQKCFGHIKNQHQSINALSDFLEWVLKTQLSEVDASGATYLAPGFQNPIKRTRSRGNRPYETVRNALPYAYIRELRHELAQGLNFCDWRLARCLSGELDPVVGLSASDWVEIAESDIVDDDPDFVWRTRLTSTSGRSEKIFEMWSPVRWVALLMKLLTPARGFQVRMLDSGEADRDRLTVRADGRMFPNRPLLSHQQTQKDKSSVQFPQDPNAAPQLQSPFGLALSSRLLGSLLQ